LRHDRINGKRCVEAAECEFKSVKMRAGAIKPRAGTTEPTGARAQQQSAP
jgi:hypothetical protein